MVQQNTRPRWQTGGTEKYSPKHIRWVLLSDACWDQKISGRMLVKLSVEIRASCAVQLFFFQIMSRVLISVELFIFTWYGHKKKSHEFRSGNKSSMNNNALYIKLHNFILRYIHDTLLATAKSFVFTVLRERIPVVCFSITYLLTYLFTYLLHGAESFSRS